MNSELSLAYIDIDNFKSINDNYGHHVGDEVLQKVATLLKNSIRIDTDTCYRIGGDEFAILMPRPKNNNSAMESIDLGHITITVNEYLSKYDAGVSIGTVTRRDGEEISSLIERADHLMYAQKRKM